MLKPTLNEYVFGLEIEVFEPVTHDGFKLTGNITQDRVLVKVVHFDDDLAKLLAQGEIINSFLDKALYVRIRNINIMDKQVVRK